MIQVKPALLALGLAKTDPKIIHEEGSSELTIVHEGREFQLTYNSPQDAESALAEYYNGRALNMSAGDQVERPMQQQAQIFFGNGFDVC